MAGRSRPSFLPFPLSPHLGPLDAPGRVEAVHLHLGPLQDAALRLPVRQVGGRVKRDGFRQPVGGLCLFDVGGEGVGRERGRERSAWGCAWGECGVVGQRTEAWQGARLATCALRRWWVEGGRPKDERRRGEGAPPLRGARAAAAGVQKKEGAARRPPVPCPPPSFNCPPPHLCASCRTSSTSCPR